MDANRISIARLLELGVPITWQEAVAVTQEVTVIGVVNATLNGHPSKIDAESCFLTRRGDVELPVRTDVDPPDAAQQLLRALLAGRDTPDDLEALAYGPASKHLGDDLAPFSRPNRRAEVAALAQRGLKAETELDGMPVAPPVPPPPPPAYDTTLLANTILSPPPPTPGANDGDTSDDEVTRLRSQVARNEPALHSDVPARKKAGVDWRVAAAVAAIVVISAGAWRWMRSTPEVVVAATPSEAPQPPVPTTEAPTIETPPAAAVPANDPPVASSAPASSQAGDIELGKGGAASPRAARPARAGNAPAVVAAPPTPPSIPAPMTAAQGTPAVDVPETATSIGAVEAFDDASVYSWTSSGVNPPVMLAPRMPRSSFPDAEQPVTGPYFEVLVDETGGVEAVRLRGQAAPGETIYRHRMLLAAAKAWQFKPALRDGRPVRYVVRIVIADDQ